MINHISILKNDQGVNLEAHEDIEQELINYFKDTLTDPSIDRQHEINNITQHITSLITDEHNQMLFRLVQLQEVDQAMAQLKVGKAPQPDGFTTNLFHFFWEDIKMEV